MLSMVAALLTLITLPLWFGATSTVQTYICQPPGVPAITSPVAGATVTTGTTVSIEGTSTATSTVTLNDNGVLFATITADDFGYFATQTPFTAGTHLLGVAAENPCGSSTGANISITAGAPPGSIPSGGILVSPALSEPVTGSELGFRIISPRDNTTTNGASIYISGTTSVLTTQQIYINGKLVASLNRPTLSFGVSVPLTAGANILRIVITDATTGATKTEEVSLHITRKPLRHDDITTSSTSAKQSWYQTTGGKIAIIIAVIFILIVIGIFLFL